MRKALSATIALCAGLALAVPAWAASDPAAQTAIQNMVSAYSGVQNLRVVEHFENGAIATVDIMPGGQYRIAETGGQDPALIVHVATQPADGAAATGTYDVTSIGKKSVDGVPSSGYKIASPDGTYTETVWIDSARDLPVIANVQTQGHNISVDFGNYNASPSIAEQPQPRR